MIKNKFRNDYEESKEGKLDYIGKYYMLPIDEAGKKKTNFLNFVFAGALFVALLIIGFINPDSSRTAYVLFPYFALFPPTAYMAVGAYSYIGAPVKMQRAEYCGSIRRMRRSVVGILILLAVNIIADGVYMVIHRSTIHWGREVLYMLGFVVMLAIAFLFTRYFDKYYARTVVE